MTWHNFSKFRGAKALKSETLSLLTKNWSSLQDNWVIGFASPCRLCRRLFLRLGLCIVEELQAAGCWWGACGGRWKCRWLDWDSHTWDEAASWCSTEWGFSILAAYLDDYLTMKKPMVITCHEPFSRGVQRRFPMARWLLGRQVDDWGTRNAQRNPHGWSVFGDSMDSKFLPPKTPLPSRLKSSLDQNEHHWPLEEWEIG